MADAPGAPPHAPGAGSRAVPRGGALKVEAPQEEEEALLPDVPRHPSAQMFGEFGQADEFNSLMYA